MLSVLFYEADELSKIIISAIFLIISFFCLIISIYYHGFKSIGYNASDFELESFTIKFKINLNDINYVELYNPEYTNTNGLYNPIRFQINKVRIICKNGKIAKFKYLGDMQETFWNNLSKIVRVKKK